MIEHDAIDFRRIAVEFTVRNNSDRTFHQLFLPLPEFLENLTIEDDTGRKLAYLPNDEVEKALEEYKRENPTGYNRFIDRYADTRYRLCLVLPKESALNPYDVRTFRLVYSDRSRPRYVRWHVLKLPIFDIRARRLLNHPHGFFYVVLAPPDTQLAVDVFDDEVRNRKSYHVTSKDELHYVFSAYLPPAEERAYSWEAEYTIGPTKLTRWALASWFFVSLVGGLWLMAAAASSSVPALGASQMNALSGGLLATSAGLIFTLKEAWADRYRALLALAALSSAIGWLIRFGGP